MRKNYFFSGLHQAILAKSATAKTTVLILTTPELLNLGSLRLEAKSPWRLETWNATMAPTEPCGLQNEGATCYLNSFLQILFNVPAMRSVRDFKSSSSSCCREQALFGIQPAPGPSPDFVVELQKLFYLMLQSTRPRYCSLFLQLTSSL